jgi:hypothetical protein
MRSPEARKKWRRVKILELARPTNPNVKDFPHDCRKGDLQRKVHTRDEHQRWAQPEGHSQKIELDNDLTEETGAENLGQPSHKNLIYRFLTQINKCIAPTPEIRPTIKFEINYLQAKQIKFPMPRTQNGTHTNVPKKKGPKRIQSQAP